MRRTATLALTAALMIAGAPAVLAQPGPPSDIPAPPAQAQGSPATGQERSAEARAHASEQSGIDVPANDQAREDGRAFGEQRAADAREREAHETGDVTEPVDNQDIHGQDLPEVDDVELPGLPEQAAQARGVLATIADALKSALNTIKSLFS
ncbi:MAG TPA: hypothetical protein VM324_12530 [Egibacteraceae bacterium]|nr:hypothetical protein [Egibacteraceae bacterium]